MIRLALLLIPLFFATAAQSAWRDEVIYFIMVDRFADGDATNNQDVDLDNPLAFHGGDLVGIRQKLDDIAELGVTAIWITPISLQIDHPIDQDGQDFFPHHGYWAEDLDRIDPRYGTEDDLRDLVVAAHRRGIKVVLDVVFNHLGYGATMVSQRPDWFRTNDTCGTDAQTLCLAGLPDFRTELPAVQKYLFAAQIGLAERTGLDGFRLDTFKHVAMPFWQALRQETRARLGKDFLLLGEVWDADRFAAQPYFKADAVDALFDFSFRDRVNKFLRGVTRGDQLGRYLAARMDGAGGHMLVPFLSNHDMSMFLAMQRGDKAALTIAATVLLSVEGPPVIVYGDETGRRGGIWPDNRQDMNWTTGDARLREKFRQLIEIRAEYAAMRGDDFAVLHTTDDTLIYRRGQDIVVAINRGDRQALAGIEGIDVSEWHLIFGEGGRLPDMPATSARIFARNL